jgi:hypothetical protein
MKIAPNLQIVVNAIRREDAKAELRALLAVARAAKVKPRGDITKAIEHHDTGGKDPACRLCRALARLDRVSGGTK